MDDSGRTSQSIEDRWGANVAFGGAGTGWTPVPAALIRNIGELGLKANDVAVLLAILMYWWEADRMPEPRIYTIARHVGLSRRTVERSVQRLRKLGFIQWGPGYDTSRGRRRAFDLRVLRERVNKLAARDRDLFLRRRQAYLVRTPEDVEKVVAGEAPKTPRPGRLPTREVEQRRAEGSRESR